MLSLFGFKAAGGVTQREFVTEDRDPRRQGAGAGVLARGPRRADQALRAAGRPTGGRPPLARAGFAAASGTYEEAQTECLKSDVGEKQQAAQERLTEAIDDLIKELKEGRQRRDSPKAAGDGGFFRHSGSV